MRKRGFNHRMKRGQAFETIMMVIAVIVALAILGFLTGILSNLGSMFNPSDPVKTMTSALQGIAGQYNSGTTPQVLAFNSPGQTIDTNQLSQNTQLLSNQIYFVCTKALGDTHAISVTNTNNNVEILKINKKITVEMVACGNPSASISGGSQPVYVIALGINGDTSGTSSACYNAFTGSAGTVSIPIQSNC